MKTKSIRNLIRVIFIFTAAVDVVVVGGVKVSGVKMMRSVNREVSCYGLSTPFGRLPFSRARPMSGVLVWGWCGAH